MKTIFSSIPQAIEQIKKGKMLIVVDHPTRENEGDFYIPAEKITIKHIMTMLTYGRGLVCTAITQEQAHRLFLPFMVKAEENTEKTKVNFTISVDANKGISSGVSAQDRLKTIKILENVSSQPEDLARPGHVFPLVAKSGGVLERNGHTEAAIDLARLAGFSPAGVLCEIVSNNGKMAKLPELQKLSQELDCKIISITDLITYLKKHPLAKMLDKTSIVKMATSLLPTRYGNFQISVFKSLDSQHEHVVLRLGNNDQPLPVRIHSQCLTGDTFFSLKCDCGDQLRQSMEFIQKNGKGIILYLMQEGRGIGLSNKIKAYALQEKGYDTVDANKKLGFPSDGRDYRIAAEILEYMGIFRIRLLTNNPEKERQLVHYGIDVVETIPLETAPNATNKSYLKAKKNRLGHRLKFV